MLDRTSTGAACAHCGLPQTVYHRRASSRDCLSLNYLSVNYLRSALTYGAIFYLISLLLLFFGGLFLGGDVPTGRGAGWSEDIGRSDVPSEPVGWALRMAEATGLSALAELLPGEGGQARWRGIAVLSTVPFLAAGMLVAC